MEGGSPFTWIARMNKVAGQSGGNPNIVGISIANMMRNIITGVAQPTTASVRGPYILP